MRKYLLPLLLLLPLTAQAQDTKVHPIDKFYQSCTDKDPSTAGMVDCTSRAYKMWDRELNKNYLSLMSKLKPGAKQSLKTAQLEWIKYRDTEFKLIDDVYAMLQGTMYIPMHAEQEMEIVKQRALALATYLDLTGEADP